jgi:hypothetical protein
LSLPTIKSARIDGAIRRGPEWPQRSRSSGRFAQAVRPCLMCPRLIVVKRIKREHPAQMRFAKDQEMVQALAPNAPDQSLDIGILPGRARRNRSVPNAHRPHPSREDRPIGFVVVAHQVSRRCIPWECLHDLSCQPLCCRLLRHREPQQLSPAVANDPSKSVRLRLFSTCERRYEVLAEAACV